jgi:replicative superfamily II helicase
MDVAAFLRYLAVPFFLNNLKCIHIHLFLYRVNPYQGLFYFDNGFRPVPLEQHFIGVKGKPNSTPSNERMNRACFDKVADLVRDGHQVMVFVHARKETVKTGQMLREEVAAEGLGGKNHIIKKGRGEIVRFYLLSHFNRIL